jgi:fatty acid desaturase
MPTETRPSHYSLPENDFNDLLTEVTNKGCYKRTYGKYLLLTIFTILGLSLSLFFVTQIDSLWLQILNAVVFAFLSVQLGLIGHDLSHGGVFNSKTLNRNLALVVWGLGCGLSEGRWFYKHNAHHQSPNHIGHDPDLEIPFVFSHEQADTYSHLYKKWIFPHQHIIFWFGLWFVYPYNIMNSMGYLFKDISFRSIVEMFLMAVHFVFIFGFTFYFLPTTLAIVFNLVTFLVMGAYMGLIFAPNHKGEDMLEADKTYNWVHQITLTRNIYPSLLVSYFLGGLEHQVEHHLFPTMPRFKYAKARIIVENFCKAKNLPYHQTTWLESLQQIHLSLKEEAKAWQK